MECGYFRAWCANTRARDSLEQLLSQPAGVLREAGLADVTCSKYTCSVALLLMFAFLNHRFLQQPLPDYRLPPCRPHTHIPTRLRPAPAPVRPTAALVQLPRIYISAPKLARSLPP